MVPLERAPGGWFVMVGGAPPPRPAEGTALDRFTRWLTALGDALEAADSEALKPLFTVEATFSPDPFAPLAQGRRALVERVIAEMMSPGLRFEARVLGAGETYGAAHIRLVSATTTADGVVLVAMDSRGRCTALRRWSHVAGRDSGESADADIGDE